MKKKIAILLCALTIIGAVISVSAMTNYGWYRYYNWCHTVIGVKGWANQYSGYNGIALGLTQGNYWSGWKYGRKVDISHRNNFSTPIEWYYYY